MFIFQKRHHGFHDKVSLKDVQLTRKSSTNRAGGESRLDEAGLYSGHAHVEYNVGLIRQACTVVTSMKDTAI
eukprot:scaffold71190_cov19-Tisochrysis_lutea.AAC.1